MTDESRRRLALALTAGTLGFAVAQTIVAIGSASTAAPGPLALAASLGGTLLWAGVGATIVIRTGNRIGWIFLSIGVLVAAGMFGEDYVGASHRVSAEPTLPLTRWAGVLANAGSSLAASLLPLVFLLFPTGRPPTPGWRWVFRLWLIGAAMTAVWQLLRPGDVGGCPDPECTVIFTLRNPLGVPIPDTAFEILLSIGGAALLASAALGIASLFVRFRRAGALERQQLKWLLLVGLLLTAHFTTMIVLQLVLPDDVDPDRFAWMWIVFVLLIVVGIPVSGAFAILRHRLYDIDIVISKTVVYGLLALLIAGVYVGIVVGIGEAIGAGTDEAALRVGATALIALTFEPARNRLQRWANRLVYGERATPYEVMAEFGHRIAEVPSADMVLLDMAEAARAGVRASSATVQVLLEQDLRSVTVPEDAADEGSSTTIDVMHGGAPVGSLTIVKPANEPLRSAERALLDDLARHAGLAMHNVRLTGQLTRRAEELALQTDELRRSQQRIVAARDEQRRRLERELRDGVASDLTGIRRDLLRDAERLAIDPKTVAGSIEELAARADRSLEELRNVARGIFPPLLADQGLAAALEAHARKLGLSGEVRIDPVVAGTRFDPAIENAIYFCYVQAVQNALHHAPGARVQVGLDRGGDDLVLVVTDAGVGFDPDTTEEGEGMRIMRDRISALEGELTVESRPGHGTTVVARVTARTPEQTP